MKTLLMFLLKIALSLVVIAVATVIAALGVEFVFGEPRPGYVPIIGLSIYAPLLYYKVWRKRE